MLMGELQLRALNQLNKMFTYLRNPIFEFLQIVFFNPYVVNISGIPSFNINRIQRCRRLEIDNTFIIAQQK